MASRGSYRSATFPRLVEGVIPLVEGHAWMRETGLSRTGGTIVRPGRYPIWRMYDAQAPCTGRLRRRRADHLAGPGPDRDPMVAFDDQRPQRLGRRPRQRLQREPEGLQGGAHLQGHLRRFDDGRHRRLPRRQCAAHPAGLRGRHRHHDGQQGRHRAGGQGADRRRPQVRPQGLHPGRGGLLYGAERADAELPVQQLDHGAELQQGPVQEGRPGPQQPARPPGPNWCWPRPSSRPRA